MPIQGVTTLSREAYIEFLKSNNVSEYVGLLIAQDKQCYLHAKITVEEEIISKTKSMKRALRKHELGLVPQTLGVSVSLSEMERVMDHGFARIEERYGYNLLEDNDIHYE